MSYRVGVDIGGSFTDFALFDEDTKKLETLKVFSRPDQPGSEVLDGIRAAGERYGIAPSDIGYFTHGTTVGINTVIQRNGLRLALFTTEHFEDVLEIARLKIPDMFDLLSKRPEPLVPRELVFGVGGRLGARGEERMPLDEHAVRAAVSEARRRGAEGVLIAFLHSYRDPAHELRAKAIVEAEAPGWPVFCSSETWPIIREYERTMTAAIGAYVQPRVSYYLDALQKALKDIGVSGAPRLTKSNGGVMNAEQGKKECVQMILSGTASGVIGASYVSRVAGIERCMSLDIGGTSADVAIILDGEPQYAVGEKIGDFQIFIPSVSVSSIGEGGGSVAWVDNQGLLRVGPESAGSRPGPACYGRGGEKPTITDAFVALGWIGHAKLGYDAVTIDVERARAAIETVAKPLGRSVQETAEAIVSIAISGMYGEVSALVSRSGIDPSTFSMLAFGGAGPMMACLLARELKMKEVVVPTTPGVLSALGGLIADIRNDFIATIYGELETGGDIIRSRFAELRERALAWLRTEQAHHGEYRLLYSAEMRYRGQSFEIDTPLDAAHATGGDVAMLAKAFHAEHRRIYGHSDDGAAIQVVSLRLVVVGETEKPELPRRELDSREARPVGTQEVHLDGALHGVALFHRRDLAPGHHFVGPAVVAQDDTTTVVLPGQAVTVDTFGNLRIAMQADQ